MSEIAQKSFGKQDGKKRDTKRKNNALWLVTFVLISIAVVGNQTYSATVPLLYRVIAITIVGALALLASANTEKGKAFIVLLKEAKIETRKVVWPTRQETAQTTLVVMVVVLIMSLLLWALDSMLGKLISGFIG
jgi:preprotein translocase subunit SecE